jgi:aspartyl-tRNA(Asn)/glutamyl-tRNA(Gln) amidotransferase subunit B
MPSRKRQKAMNDSKYEPVIGLEIHAELRTRSKMFCGCAVVEPQVAEPNTSICPVCLGLPGALPVLNRAAVEMALRVGLSLGCEVQPRTVFARKNYFYPDLPKGYQISQYELPVCHSGIVAVPGPEGEVRIRIRRAHLEEDTAKLLHSEPGQGPPHSLVDFNRAGTPLLEIVTEPDIRSAEVVQEYATRMRTILRYLGVNSGDMEKGVLRFEANVSVRPRGSQELYTRTEIKNLNSFRHLVQAVAYEIERQCALVEGGGKVVQETLGWDEVKGATVSQRGKEEAHDYRYFPEPDLLPLRIDPGWVEQVRQGLPELADAKKARFQTQYELSEYDAGVLTAERALAEYFEEAVRAFGGPAKTVSNWVTGELARLMNEGGVPVEEVKVSPGRLGKLLGLVQVGTVNQNTAKEVLAEMFRTGAEAEEIVRAKGLTQIADEGQLLEMARKIVADNPTQVEQYLGGSEKVFGWLMGQMMRATKGKASPQVAQEVMRQALAEKKR